MTNYTPPEGYVGPIEDAVLSHMLITAFRTNTGVEGVLDRLAWISPKDAEESDLVDDSTSRAILIDIYHFRNKAYRMNLTLEGTPITADPLIFRIDGEPYSHAFMAALMELCLNIGAFAGFAWATWDDMQEGEIR